MANFSISYVYQIKDKMTPSLHKISREVKKQNEQFTMSQRLLAKMISLENRFNKKLKTASADAKRLKNELKNSVGEIVGLGASTMAIAFPVKKAMEFETAMVGVAKAANLDKGTKAFDDMQAKIMDMTKTVPKTATEIASMFEAGAKLGISADQLPDFAMITAKTSVSFDMMAEDAGDALASIKAKLGLNINELELTMDAVNQLENTTAAKGGNMINILGRVAGTAKSINLDPSQAAGLSAFADQITVSPELAASGINMMVQSLQKVPALNKMLLDDPKEALNNVFTELAAMDKLKRNTLVTKIFGDQAGRFVTAAVENLDLYKKTMGEVADKTKFAGSMTQEYDKVVDTTQSAVKIASNGLDSLAITVGAKLTPIVKAGAVALATVAFGLGKVLEHSGPLIPVIGAMAAAIIGLQVASKAYMVAQLATNAVVAVFATILEANPIGIVITLLAGLAAGVISCYNEFETFRNIVDDVFDSIKSFFGFGGDDLKIEVNGKTKSVKTPDMSGALETAAKINQTERETAVAANMKAGDVTGGTMPNGQVSVDVTARNAHVNAVRTTGTGIDARGVGYGSAMTGN